MNNKLREVKFDDDFNYLFNEDDMKTIEWVVMQILNCQYQDIHGKVKVKNSKLSKNHPNDRRRTVDLVVEYKASIIEIELNNNFDGQYIRNYLYAFTLLIKKYFRKTKKKKITNYNYYKIPYQLILVNLNWYKSKNKSLTIPGKREYVLPKSDFNDEFFLKIINVNLDYFQKISYDNVKKCDKFYKLLTINNQDELSYIIRDEELLDDYGRKIIELSKKEGKNMLWTKEIDDFLCKVDEYNAVAQEVRDEVQEEMIIGMNDNHIPLDTISKISKLSISEVENIIEQSKVMVKQDA